MSQQASPQSVITGYAHEAAWESTHLKVDSIHEIFYEQYGKKDGLPGNYANLDPSTMKPYLILRPTQ